MSKNYLARRTYIAEMLIDVMDELALLGVDNKKNLNQICKQIDTLRLLIADICPEEYSYYLNADYAFGFSDDEPELNREISGEIDYGEI